MVMIEENELQVSQTDGIVISAGPVLMDEDNHDNFLWGYYFCIENNSQNKISVVGKNWNITDDRGNLFSDNSDGFKGEIPELEPGEYFEFTSTAPLSSPYAVFYGSCRIKTEGQDKLKEVKIPTFAMTAPKVPTSVMVN